MKNKISILLIFVLIILQLKFLNLSVFAAFSIEDAILRANSDIRLMYGMSYDYYVKGEGANAGHIVNNNGERLNTNLLIGNWDRDGFAYRPSNSEYFKELSQYNIEFNNEDRYFNVFVFGSKPSDAHYLGQDMEGNLFSNVYHPVDIWNNNKAVEEYSWVYQPWLVYTSSNSQQAICTQSDFDLLRIQNIINRQTDAARKQELEEYYEDLGKLVQDYFPLSFEGMNAKFDGSYKTTNWLEYIHIMQPPTYYTWGMGRMWNSGGQYYKTILIPPFKFLDQPDYSATILRTGTEDGADENGEYEAVVEFRVNNCPQSGEVRPPVTIELEGGHITQGAVPGYCILTPEIVEGWVQHRNGTFTVSDKTPVMDGIDWMNRLLTTEGGRGKEYRAGEHVPFVKELDGGVSAYCRIGSDKKTVKSYIRFKWKPNESAEQVKMKVSINMGPNNLTEGASSGNNYDEAVMGISKRLSASGEYVLDYDVVSRDFIYGVNNGQPLNARLELPHNSSGWYDWSASWAEGSQTSGQLDKLLSDPSSIAGSMDYGVEYDPISTSETSVSKLPSISWTTKKSHFGFEPSTGRFKSNGSFSYGSGYAANGNNPLARFKLDSFGEIFRTARYSAYRSYHSHSSSCYNSEGVRVCGRSSGPYNHVSGTVTQTARFPYCSDTVEIQSMTYNGKGMPLINLKKDERTEGTGAGAGAKRKIVWEGDRWGIPVVRYMRSIDRQGNTSSLSVVPGNHGGQRIFQHLDSAEVSYSVDTSFAGHFQADRDNAYNNEGNYKGYGFKYAPFATDRQLQRYAYPIKSGYFYVPYAVYRVSIKTEIYKREGQQTEHNSIVNSVKSSFVLDIGLPTMKRNGDAVIDTDGRKYGSYPVQIGQQYSKSERKLEYGRGPENNAGMYLTGSEEQLLGNTDPLFKRILEGWTYSGTQGSWGGTDSAASYKYREYVSEADIYKIEEQTTLTFTVNPEKLKFYIIPKTADGVYGISVSFGEFTNTRTRGPDGSAAQPVKLNGAGQTDVVAFTVVGSMYDD
ncbi:hypothetical protein DFR58_10519 [Anaerobacterium chartisolvens]|uniref:DUF5704 domain-containing protein n=1 Tax=Anaerobacterium chartisolvens TaxID=1297424 RepID=A0A369BA34_9FIRM|nr:hypothetical protein [Anaerobacterium chartisolvens]RCX18261.1 hypothetical protein DFR58_10519 [Anaerobacterium chartisolvens]